jgi:opacity protein-like surface antigen
MYKYPFCGTVVLALWATTAFAGQPQLPRPISSWYMHANAGAVVSFDIGGNSEGSLRGTSFKPNPKHNGMFEAGVGYRFNRYARTDVTVGMLPQMTMKRPWTHRTTYNGVTVGYQNYVGEDRQELDPSYYFLLNGYADIPTGTSLTPYITAGVGMSHIAIDKSSSASTVNDGMAFLYDSDPTLPGSSHWNLAKRAGGGMSYRLTPQLRLDLGYRYTDLGRVKATIAAHNDTLDADDPDAIDADLNHTPQATSKYNLRMHQLLLGLRYHF